MKTTKEFILNVLSNEDVQDKVTFIFKQAAITVVNDPDIEQETKNKLMEIINDKEMQKKLADATWNIVIKSIRPRFL